MQVPAQPRGHTIQRRSTSSIDERALRADTVRRSSIVPTAQSSATPPTSGTVLRQSPAARSTATHEAGHHRRAAQIGGGARVALVADGLVVELQASG